MLSLISQYSKGGGRLWLVRIRLTYPWGLYVSGRTILVWVMDLYS